MDIVGPRSADTMAVMDMEIHIKKMVMDMAENMIKRDMVAVICMAEDITRADMSSDTGMTANMMADTGMVLDIAAELVADTGMAADMVVNIGMAAIMVADTGMAGGMGMAAYMGMVVILCMKSSSVALSENPLIWSLVMEAFSGRETKGEL